MPKYMLVLHNDVDGWFGLSPEQRAKDIQKFVAWEEKLAQQGLLVGSQKLVDDAGKVIRSKGKVLVTDGPYAETREVFGGYFIIEAANYHEAVARCQDCPILEYNGSIEVRMLEENVPKS